MRVLLDKGFIRRMFEGFARKAEQRPLTEEQKAVARLLRKYYGTAELYMSYKSFHRADKFVTLDKRLYERFQIHYSAIGAAFTKMIKDLEPPFNSVKLPEIELPSETQPIELS